MSSFPRHRSPSAHSEQNRDLVHRLRETNLRLQAAQRELDQTMQERNSLRFDVEVKDAQLRRRPTEAAYFKLELDSLKVARDLSAFWKDKYTRLAQQTPTLNSRHRAPRQGPVASRRHPAEHSIKTGYSGRQSWGSPQNSGLGVR
jgi:hypothetical protein